MPLTELSAIFRFLSLSPYIFVRNQDIMAGGGVLAAVHGGTTDLSRTEAPVTIKTYLMCGMYFYRLLLLLVFCGC